MFVYSLILNILGIVSLYSCIVQNHQGFEYLWMLPATYLLCYNLFIHKSLLAYPLKTLHIANFTMAIRTIMLAFWISNWPLYAIEVCTPEYNLIRKGCCFICYEILFVSVFFFIVCRKMQKKDTLKNNLAANPNINEGNLFYFAAAILALCAFLFIPESHSTLHFLKLPTGTSLRVGLWEASFWHIFVRQVIVTGMGSLVVAFLLANHQKGKNSLRILVQAVPIFLFMGTIVGEQRAVQVYAAASCFFALKRCYPKQIKKLGIILCVFMLGILVFMTIYKSFYAFNSDDYLGAVTAQEFEPERISKIFEYYTLGPVCLGSVFALDSSHVFEDSDNSFLFDICRPIMGMNVIVKDFDYRTTSEIYNNFCSRSGLDTSGILVPISANMYLYFGFIIAPVLICCFYLLAIIFEIIINKASSLFIVFWCSYCYIRLATCMVCSDISTILTILSLVFLFTFPFYFLQKVYDSSKMSLKTKESLQ